MSLPFSWSLWSAPRGTSRRNPHGTSRRTRGLRLEPLERRELLNAAPVIDSEAMFMLDPIAEDVAPAANTGTLVANLIAAGVTDTDPTDTLGIAITDLDTQYGTWQYTTNGTDWHDLSAPTAGNAFLLAGDVNTAIRFLPEQDFFGDVDPAITFCAWDGTSGTAGTTADISDVGGETAFSSDTATASLAVDPVNDAPTFDPGAVFTLDSIDENVSQDDNTGTLILDLISQGVTDPDPADFLGIAITAIDTAHGTWQYTTDGTNWNALAAPAAGSAFLLDGDGLTAIRFLPDTDYHGTVNSAITFYAWDESTGDPEDTVVVADVADEMVFSSTTAAASLTVDETTNAPVLAEIESTALAYAEDDPAAVITSTITVADADSTNLAGATIIITTNYQNGQDVLAFADTSTITGTWNPATGTLTLSGTDTLANYQAALRAVKYENTSEAPNTSARTVTLKVSDGTNDSNALSRSITVTADNDAPVLAGIESAALAYTENDPATAITGMITVADVDSADINGATVQITNNYQSGQDVLSFTNTSAITATWNTTTGTLTLTGIATLADYQAALRAVKYANTSEAPTTSVRTVTIKVNDGTDDSNELSRSINITAANDAPVLAGIESTALTYTEDDPATAITSTITVADVDSANVSGATVQITDNYQNGQDVLSFTNTSTITGIWNATTGTLTLSGTDTLANYQAALRAVKYENTSETPNTSARTVTFKVNDGTDDSSVLSRSINVTADNEAPVLAAIESAALAYTENDPATIITSTITVADADSTNLSGATIIIATNYQNGHDVLSFTNTSTITGTWNPTTGTLTLTGSATLADYQAALRAVKYANTSETPDTSARTVTFKVNDGTDDSNVLSRSITVTAATEAPILAGVENTALAYAENAAAIAITSTMTVADADSTTLTGATVQITGNYQSAQDVLSFTNTSTITGTWNATTGTLTLTGTDTLANYQAALRAVKYANSSDAPNTSARTVTFKVNDGTADSNSLTRSITVTASNDAPVLDGIESAALAYTENDAATAITSTITTSDVDSTSLTGATVQITGNYQGAQDVLSFTNTSTITGTWNSATGTLTLTGTDTLANYQAALRAVKYRNTSDTPNTSARTVVFKVNDGSADSNTLSRSITVTATNDAPVLAGIETAALVYAEGAAATVITNTITVTDVDSTNLTGATVQITGNYQSAQDILSFTNTSTITGTWNATTGTLTLTGTDTLANYQAALRAVKYQNSSSDPNTSLRTVTFTVTDGTANSNSVTRNIAINAPVLSGIESSALAYTENAAATAITSTIMITDVDSANLNGATVQITGNYQSAQDVLSFTNTSTITGTWNATTGTLTLTGTDTLANYQAALRAVKYANSSDAPNTSARTVTFKVNDGTSDSNSVTRNITVTAVNDAPVLAGIESAALAYTENGAATAITSTITTSDVDSTTITGATVQITGNYQSAQDVLSFTNTSTITGTWNSATGTLTLTGTDTLANYQAALRAVKYANSSDAPDTDDRTVTFKVNDGSAYSNTLTRTITVTATNDAPVLAAIETSPLAYATGGAATAITSTITTSDVDSTTITGATVQLTTNYQSAQDVLSFTNTSTITGTWNSATGTLTLTGTDTLANYQAALRAVKYQNSSSSPNTAARTAVFKVNDGSADSNAATRTITINAPVLAGIETTALTFAEGAAATAITSTITTSDPDSTNLTSATVQITGNYQSGADVLSFTNTSTITGTWNATTGTLTLTGTDTLANYQAALRAIKYQNTSEAPSTLSRTVTFKVNDGSGDSNSLTRSITVTASNDAPVLAGIETAALAYDEGDAATAITSTITTSDVDNTNLTSATVQITGNYQSGQDVLSFTNTSTITGTWNSSTGTLTLTGSDTLANYQAALRAVKYSNSSSSPNTSARTVTFKVYDGTAYSNALTRNITVASDSDAPVLGGIESAALAYAENASATAITSSITVTDGDSTNLTRATIQITGNYKSGQDVLSFTNTSKITGTWDATTGTLTLTGSDTVANYQAALRTVKYQNSSNTPDTSSRTVTFKVNDGTSDSNAVTRSITVTAANDAPVLDSSKDTTLPSIAKGDTTNSGTLVSTLINGIVTDADGTDALTGIAVISTPTTSLGTWQYSVDAGTTWQAVGTVSESQALLLRSQDKIRFVPSGTAGGTASFTFVAWDQTGDTSGDQGTKVSASTRGTTTAFSTNSEIASIAVGGSIKGSVFLDANSDGVRQSTETPMANVVVTLRRTDSSSTYAKTVTTDQDGTFYFDNLEAGTYEIVEAQPTKFKDGTEIIGTASGAAADDLTNGVSKITGVTISDTTQGTGYGFGEGRLKTSSVLVSLFKYSSKSAKERIADHVGSSTVTISGSSSTDEVEFTPDTENSGYHTVTITDTSTSTVKTRQLVSAAVDQILLNGGTGSVILNGTTGADEVTVKGKTTNDSDTVDQAILYLGGGTHSVTVRKAKAVTINAQSSTATATINDSSGNDKLTADDTSVTLKSSYDATLNDFHSVTAYSTAGSDTVKKTGAVDYLFLIPEDKWLPDAS